MRKIYPSPPVPTRRPLSTRWCAVALVLAIVPALLLGLSGCGGGGGGEAAAPPPPAQGRSEALNVSAPGELLSYVKTKLRQRADARAANPMANVNGTTAAPALGLAAGPGATAAITVRSTTTVQEAGVDEPDLIKTDGSVILSLNPDARVGGVVTPRLHAHRRLADGSLLAMGTLDTPATAPAWQVSRGLIFAEAPRRAAVLAESVNIVQGGSCTVPGDCVSTGIAGSFFAVLTQSTVDVQLATASSTGLLTRGDRLAISGRLVGARLIGNTLVLVSSYTPLLAVEALPSTATAAEREALLTQLRTADLLPTLRVNGGAARALLADTDCWLQPANASLGIALTTITTLDLSVAGAAPVSRCIVGGSEALYMSASSLVLATTRTSYGTQATIVAYPSLIQTDIHKFALGSGATAGTVSYRGSGSVDGHLGWDIERKASRISEFGGDVRVLSYTGSFGWGDFPSITTAASPATLTVLRERASDLSLQVLARLPNAQRPAALGKAGEQVYAVRFMGDKAYVVTFRQTDPLYVIDLASPADPRTVGELVVPGVSESLFPLPGGLLFGVGREADDSGRLGAVKVSLLDVSDPSRPRELSTQRFGNPLSSSALDYSPQGLNLLQAGTTARIALPMLVFPASAPVTNPGAPSQLLQRFEVDSTARTLTLRPSIVSSSTPGHGLWTERSVQIGNDLYYLSNGGLTRWAW